MAKMLNPPHPAAILREDVLPALGLTVTEAARQLGVSRLALSRVLNERAGISVNLAQSGIDCAQPTYARQLCRMRM